jgi:hypothetical protein
MHVICSIRGSNQARGRPDDTLFHRVGRSVFAAAWQHDGSAKGRNKTGRGNCFVIAAILVDLPFCSRPVALPVLFRLWRPAGKNSENTGGGKNSKNSGRGKNSRGGRKNSTKRPRRGGRGWPGLPSQDSAGPRAGRPAGRGAARPADQRGRGRGLPR